MLQRYRLYKLVYFFIERESSSWGIDSAVESAGCSTRGARFHSQQVGGNLQSSRILTNRGTDSSSGFLWNQTCKWYIDIHTGITLISIKFWKK